MVQIYKNGKIINVEIDFRKYERMFKNKVMYKIYIYI